MALTIDEQERVHAAELQKMTYQIMAAIEQGNPETFTEIRNNLLDFGLDIEVPMELRYKAKEVHDSAALGMTNAGLAQMTQIAETITNAGSGIRNAIRIAETGKAELFFPSLAADAAKAVTLFEKLLDTAEVLGSDQSLKDKIKNVAEAAKELRNVVES